MQRKTVKGKKRYLDTHDSLDTHLVEVTISTWTISLEKTRTTLMMIQAESKTQNCKMHRTNKIDTFVSSIILVKTLFEGWLETHHNQEFLYLLNGVPSKLDYVKL